MAAFVNVEYTRADGSGDSEFVKLRGNGVLDYDVGRACALYDLEEGEVLTDVTVSHKAADRKPLHPQLVTLPGARSTWTFPRVRVKSNREIEPGRRFVSFEDLSAVGQEADS